MKMPLLPIYDVLILGGGPAGLSTALSLARVRRTALVISHGSFRNNGVHEMHAVLGHDKRDPADFRKEAKKQIGAYGSGIQFAESEIVRVAKAAIGEGLQGFLAEGRDGSIWHGRKLVLAMGSRDVFPDTEGYAENWPTNIYQCLFCDGRERSHLPMGQLGFPSSSHLNHLMMLRHLGGEGADVTVFTNGPLPEDNALLEAVKAAESLGTRFETANIIKYERVPSPGIGIRVCLEDGRKISLGFLLDKPSTVPVGEEMLVEGLGVEIASDPLGRNIKKNEPFGETSVKGCFVAGDAGSSLKHVTMAVTQGVGAAGGTQAQLCAEEAQDVLASLSNPRTRGNVEEAC
ncbi:MAG: hypothetical protein Q9163_003133 [Psora crenata]